MDKAFTFIFLMAFGSACIAQQTNALHFQWSVNCMHKPNESWVDYNSKSLLLGNNVEKKAPYNPITEVKYTIHHEAIFCRMEDALHQHLNIWLKVRMGTEDKYSD